MLQKTSRSIVAAVIGLVVVAIIILFMPRYPITPKGIVLPSPTAEKSTVTNPARHITFYDELNAPLGSSYLGYVNVVYHAPQATLAAQQAVYNYAAKLARQHGGNAIIIMGAGHTPLGTATGLSAQVLYGQIIRTLNGDN